MLDLKENRSKSNRTQSKHEQNPILKIMIVLIFISLHGSLYTGMHKIYKMNIARRKTINWLIIEQINLSKFSVKSGDIYF